MKKVTLNGYYKSKCNRCGNNTPCYCFLHEWSKKCLCASCFNKLGFSEIK